MNSKRTQEFLLIGRIGEKGKTSLVGKRGTEFAHQPGALYLRINDDKLGDNWGWVEVDVEVTPPEE